MSQSSSPKSVTTSPLQMTSNYSVYQQWNCSPAPSDPILQLAQLVKKDTNQNTLDLTIGAYRDNHGHPHQFDTIKQACSFIYKQEKQNLLSRQYLPSDGDQKLISLAIQLIYGKHVSINDSNLVAIHTISASAALRIALEFAKKVLNVPMVLISNPSWSNHSQLVTEANLKMQHYKYYDDNKKQVDIDQLLKDLSITPRGSLVILQPCAHNPTGMDLTKHQWYCILDIIRKHGLIPLFDMAYQGLASGDIEEDAWAIRLFAQNGIPILVAQSFSKNMGLYNSRVGTLSIHLPLSTQVEKVCENVLSHLKWIVRAMYSSPAAEGARIVCKILQDKLLYSEWKMELLQIVNRLTNMRLSLYEAIVDRNISGDWEYILKTKGMFLLLGLSKEQVLKIREKHHVYITNDSRINVGGLTMNTVNQLADAIADVIE